MSYASSILASKYQPDYAQANVKVNIPTRFVRLEKRRPGEEKQILNLEALWQQTQAEQAVSWCPSLVQNLDNPKNYSLKTGTTMQT
jgi:hypothetical protein